MTCKSTTFFSYTQARAHFSLFFLSLCLSPLSSRPSLCLFASALCGHSQTRRPARSASMRVYVHYVRTLSGHFSQKNSPSSCIFQKIIVPLHLQRLRKRNLKIMTAESIIGITQFRWRKCADLRWQSYYFR